MSITQKTFKPCCFCSFFTSRPDIKGLPDGLFDLTPAGSRLGLTSTLHVPSRPCESLPQPPPWQSWQPERRGLATIMNLLEA